MKTLNCFFAAICIALATISTAAAHNVLPAGHSHDGSGVLFVAIVVVYLSALCLFSRFTARRLSRTRR